MKGQLNEQSHDLASHFLFLSKQGWHSDDSEVKEPRYSD